MLESDELIARVADELRRPVGMDPAIDGRVMAEVRAHPRRRRAWFLRPRPVSITPLSGLALAATLAAIVVGATLAAVRLRPAPGAISVASAVPLVLYAPTAHSVVLVGDFNDWDTAATPLQPTGSAGAWIVTVPLPPGRYRYGFVIDGTRWLADPGAPPAPDNDFGTPNSVLTVGT